MGVRRVDLALTSAALWGTILALQVAPGSPCVASCVDNPSQNLTDSSTSDTFGGDIVCIDADYSGTQAGQKFETCMTCLQHSSAKGTDGSNDQEWFFYNLRYSLATCLNGFASPSDSDHATSICSSDTSCGPLQGALTDGNLLPGNESEYSFCEADNNAIRGSSLGNCVNCLRNTSDQVYLANFLAALDAACNQRPVPGYIVGLAGSVFSTTPITEMYAGFNQTSTTSTTTHKGGGLSKGAIIGIAVGLAVLLAVAAAVLITCYKKQRGLKRLKGIHSPLHARFGDTTITAPTDGAYGNPYSREVNQAAEPFDPNALSKKERNVLTEARSVIAKHQSSPRDGQYPAGTQNGYGDMASQLPAYTGAALPTHLAYIPPQDVATPASHPSSDGTSDSYKMSPYPSSRSYRSSTSPQYIPRPSSTSPRNMPSNMPTPASAQPSPHIEQILEHGVAPVSSAKSSPHVYQSTGQQPSSPPRSGNYAAAQPWDRPSPGVSSTSQEGRSRISPRGLQPSPSVSNHSHSSRTESWKRGTRALGIGNSNATQVAAPPVQISGPIMQHGGRRDFEIADRERRGKEKMAKLRLDLHKRREEADPDSAASAESAEQWPGSY